MDTSSFPICAICHDEITPLDKTIMPKGCCIHDPFHEKCFKLWIKVKAICPIDKNPVDCSSYFSYKEVVLITLQPHLRLQAKALLPFMALAFGLDFCLSKDSKAPEEWLSHFCIRALGIEIGLFSKNISDWATRWFPDLRIPGIDFVQAGAMLSMTAALSHIPLLSTEIPNLFSMAVWGTCVDTGRLCWRP